MNDVWARFTGLGAISVNWASCGRGFVVAVSALLAFGECASAAAVPIFVGGFKTGNFQREMVCRRHVSEVQNSAQIGAATRSAAPTRRTNATPSASAPPTARQAATLLRGHPPRRASRVNAGTMLAEVICAE